MSKAGFDIPDSHLQSAIRPHLTVFFLSETENAPEHIKTLRNRCPFPRTECVVENEWVYGKIFKDGIRRPDRASLPQIRESFRSTYTVVLNFLKSHTHRLNISGDLVTQKETLSDQTYIAYDTKEKWESIRIYMQHLKNHQICVWKKFDCKLSYVTQAFVSQSFLCILVEGGKYILLNYDQVMMITDTLISRCMTLWYMEYLQSKVNGVSEMIILECYSIFDDLLINQGNDAYTQIKSWEAIIQGMMLSQHDPLTYASKFLDNILIDLEASHQESALQIYHLLQKHHLSVYQLAELHGLYRHWGHPTVDEEAGCRKVKKIAQSRPIPNQKAIDHMTALLKKQFCISFISIHRRWPRIDVSHLPDTSPIRIVIQSNITHVNLYSPHYPLEDWGKIEMLKEFDFDFHTDFTDLCDDKALSVYRGNLASIYCPDVLGSQPPRPIESRRVLLEMIRKRQIDIKEICEIIMDRKVPLSWYIILLHAKEREIKWEPRLFAMMVLEMRLYMCVTESNLASYIFKYFPQQTMTLSEHELTKRILNLSLEDDEGSYAPVFASIDFKSWNLHWSYASTAPFFKIVDDLFNTPGLYTFTHNFFQNSLIALASYYNPPQTLRKSKDGEIPKWDVTDPSKLCCDTIWTDHLGGLEGLRQKGWTLITICLLLYVESLTGIKCYIIGQGDNQICKLMIPKTSDKMPVQTFILANQQYMSDQISLFFSTLNKSAEHLGLVVKTEESWVSSTIINYGKEIIYKGAYMAQGSKRISRTMSDVNEVYPTLMSKVSTMQTTGLATSQKGYDLFVPYIICTTETLVIIDREIKYSLLVGGPIGKMDKSWATDLSAQLFLLHGNSNVFSLPISSPYDYIYRGHPDPLTTYTTFIYDNYTHCSTCRGIYSYLTNLGVTPGPGDPLLLISDPLSLNLERPPQVSQMMRDQVHTALIEKSQNRELRQIFHKVSQTEDQQVYQYLIKSEPCYARVLHEILRLTPTGTRLALTAKFSNTRTILQITSRSLTKRFYEKIRDSEIKHCQYWAAQLELIKYYMRQPILDICPTRTAQRLRDYTWSRTLAGRPIKGVTVPFPLHQFSINHALATNHTNCHGDTPFIYLQYMDNNIGHSMMYTRGSVNPYLGSTTREKQTGKIFQVPEKSRPLTAAQRILQIQQWCVSDVSEINTFLTHLVTLHTDIPTDILKLSAGSIFSGSLMHRLNDHLTKRSTLQNTRPNVSSHLYISTDTMAHFGKGSENINLHFQGSILTGISIAHLHCYIDDRIKIGDSIHLHFDCSRCLEYLPNRKLINDEIPPSLRVIKNNKLLYTQVGSLPIGFNPDNNLFTMVHSANSAQAAAYVILSRAIKGMRVKVWGVSEQSGVLVSQLSIQDLIKIKLHNILYELARLMYLYFYDERDNFIMYLSTASVDLWGDIAALCLIPEILDELHTLSEGQTISSLYESKWGLAQLLSRALGIQLSRVENQYRKYSEASLSLTAIDAMIPFPVGFIVPGCSFFHIFKMWTTHIYLVSNRVCDLRDNIRLLSNYPSTMVFPPPDVMELIYRNIQRTDMSSLTRLLFIESPLRVSIFPPEALLGNQAEICAPLTKHIKDAPVSMKPVRFDRAGFSQLHQVPSVMKELEPIQSSFLPEVSVREARDLSDHQYYLVGDLSSCILKYCQIILHFQPSLTSPIVCLADGDGELARFLHNYSGQIIYFNTLVHREALIAQRAVDYVPSSFIDRREYVKGSPLSALLGGDLTDPTYITAFSEILPTAVSLVTMDAESSNAFDPGQKINLVKSTLIICHRTNAQHLLLKTYCDHSHVLSTIIGMVNVYFDNIWIIVPIFSSNTTYEIILYASLYSPPPSGTHPDMMTQLSRACHVTCKKLKMDRITSTLFPRSITGWESIVKSVISLGYSFNVKSALERLCDYYFTYKEGSRIETWLQENLHRCVTYLHLMTLGFSKMFRGRQLTRGESLSIADRHSMHLPINQLCTIILNLQLLQQVLQLRGDKDIKEVIIKAYEDGYDHIQDNVRLFSTGSIDTSISQKYIKRIWQVVGYKRYADHLMKG